MKEQLLLFLEYVNNKIIRLISIVVIEDTAVSTCSFRTLFIMLLITITKVGFQACNGSC